MGFGVALNMDRLNDYLMSTPTLKTPLIIVNFKAYREGVGENALRLARVAERVAAECDVCVAVAVQPTDIFRVSSETGVPVLAQHIDPVGYGSHTGHILPEAVREAGAVGTLINHSERRVSLDFIRRAVERAGDVGLTTVVCADVVEMCRRVAEVGPDMVAIEPPELIGTGIAVSKAKPEVVSGAVEAVKAVNPDVSVLCGAGITSGEDVETALRLGAEGVLVASGVVKAGNPYRALLSMARAIVRI